MRSPASLFAAAAMASTMLLPSAVSAFASTSPFFILSSGRDSQKLNTQDTISSSSSAPIPTSEFLVQAKAVISPCDSDVYIVAQQAGIHASDFRAGGMGYVKRVLAGGVEGVRGEAVVPYVQRDGVSGSASGRVDGALVEMTRRACGAEVVVVNPSEPMMHHYGDMKPKVFHIVFPELEDGLSRKERTSEIQLTDNFLNALLTSSLPPSTKWVLIYVSTPITTTHNHHHTTTSNDELKRRSPQSPSTTEKNDNSTTPPPEFTPPTGGLFQKYVFFSPGIFMGYIAAFFLGILMVVGLSGLGSLKISYGAFEKEMGPAAQRKAQ
ncbi:BIG/ATPase V1 complex, subunit S1 [Peziza echinospora]|nr:BIG/ATPase V1 complex, subunit S1 [Peziza echinospora]